MLVHPISNRLQTFRFLGMHSAYEEQLQKADIDQFNFDERLRLLVDFRSQNITDRIHYRQLL